MKQLISEIFTDAAIASEDAFERALMDCEVFDAFNKALEEGIEKLKMYCSEREISFDPERMEKDYLTICGKFYEKVHKLIFDDYNGIICEFCDYVDELTDTKRLLNLTEIMSKEFTATQE